MRRKYFGLAMAAIATLGPAQAFGGDREIAQTIIERLKTARDAGDLKNFNLDMKVDDGVVLFRGSVDSAAQQELVLGAASQLDGIARVVNELKIVQPSPAEVDAKREPAAVATTVSKPEPITIASPKATLVKPKSNPMAVAAPSKAAASPVESPKSAPTAADNFDFTQAIATIPAPTVEKTAPVAKVQPIQIPQPIEAGNIQPAAAFEQPVTQDEAPMQTAPAGPSDDRITEMIASALGKAKQMGHLKSFGVDVNAVDGIVELTGKAASDQQRNLIGQIAGGAPGVRGVRNMIDVSSQAISAQPVAHRQNLMPMPTPAPTMQNAVHPMPPRPTNTQAQPASYGAGYGGQMINGEMVVPGSIVNHGAVGGGQVVGAPMMGAPVPMAPAAPAGAPRYDSPNLPNYAWPGYAAYPNYAALSYPQQYSPSAFPYIGPFYPYPQVPLGWRKVSLEWDDGWWFLDFTDR